MNLLPAWYCLVLDFSSPQHMQLTDMALCLRSLPLNPERTVGPGGKGKDKEQLPLPQKPECPQRSAESRSSMLRKSIRGVRGKRKLSQHVHTPLQACKEAGFSALIPAILSVCLFSPFLIPDACMVAWRASRTRNKIKPGS